MLYTLKRGVDYRSEKLRDYLLRGLPILVACLIAIVGAFVQTSKNEPSSRNQQPIAIYTEPPTDFGNTTNPQGSGNSTQSASGDPQSSHSVTAPQSQATLPLAATNPQSPAPTTFSSAPTPQPSIAAAEPVIDAAPTPVGGSGGESPSPTCTTDTSAGTIPINVDLSKPQVCVN